jgi:methyl-accepting chemotaxis protein
MSATSEELAAHAEQLQTSVAFFHMETSGRPAPAHHAAVVTSPRRAAPPAATQRAAKPAPAHNGKDKSKSGGFALNLTTGGADHRDAEFERM